MSIEEAIEVLYINRGCAELEKSNGLISKNNEEFIVACSIAISVLEEKVKNDKSDKDYGQGRQ